MGGQIEAGSGEIRKFVLDSGVNQISGYRCIVPEWYEMSCRAQFHGDNTLHCYQRRCIDSSVEMSIATNAAKRKRQCT